MPKLHQILAMLIGKKTKAQAAVTALYKEAQKAARFEGFAKEYRPVDDEGGEKLPPERKNIPVTSKAILSKAREHWTGLFDLVAAQDAGNRWAMSNVEVDGVTLLKDVPVSTLIFLEKRLEEVRDMITALPVLPPEKNWKWSADANCYVSDVEQTRKTTKVRKAQTLYEHTDKHPAQVEAYTIDETCGWWHTTHQSGALPAEEKESKLTRVNALIDAVKIARAGANEYTVAIPRIADPVFDFIFEGAKPSSNSPQSEE